MFLHLLQRVQAVLDLYIWSWARREGPSPWGELVPRGLRLGFRCTLAQVCQDAQSFLLPFLRGTGHTKESIKHVSPRGALDGQREHPWLTRQNQSSSQQVLRACHEPILSGTGDTRSTQVGLLHWGYNGRFSNKKHGKGTIWWTCFRVQCKHLWGDGYLKKNLKASKAAEGRGGASSEFDGKSLRAGE